MRRMSIAMISEHASPLAVLGGADGGGQNVHVAALATALARMGNSVTVYTRRDNRRVPQRVPLCRGVMVEHVLAGPPAPLSKDELLPHMEEFGERLRRRWRAESPDVVHAHFWMSGLAALRAARPLGVPVVQTFHALGVVKRRQQGTKDTSPRDRIEIEKGIVRDADRVIATCSDELFELVRLGAPPTRVDVVPCGVDLSLFRPDGPSEDRHPRLRRAVIVSRFVERKGIGNAIAAIARVPRCELLIAGGPPAARLEKDAEARRYLSMAAAHGVSDRVHLLGSISRDRVPALLRSADVVVCVPWYEPFGIVPLEAMACGVPVLATAVGGLTDTVVDGVTGFHVPPRRPRAIAEKIKWLLRDDSLRRRFGEAGVERARTRYGWDTVAAQTLESYSRLAPVEAGRYEVG